MEPTVAWCDADDDRWGDATGDAKDPLQQQWDAPPDEPMTSQSKRRCVSVALTLDSCGSMARWLNEAEAQATGPVDTAQDTLWALETNARNLG